MYNVNHLRIFCGGNHVNSLLSGRDGQLFWKFCAFFFALNFIVCVLEATTQNRKARIGDMILAQGVEGGGGRREGESREGGVRESAPASTMYTP